MQKEEMTTIAVKVTSRNKIKDMKVHKNESFADVVERILNNISVRRLKNE